MPSLRGRRRDSQQEKENALPEEETEKVAPRKHSMHEFFRSTGENFKAVTARIPRRRSGQEAKDQPASPTPSSRSRHSEQLRSLDIGDDALDRVMGLSKEPKMTSDSSSVEQRLRADSRRAPSDSGLTHTASHRSKAEGNRSLLGVQELREMFTGAPYFSVSSVRNGYEPRVVFGDEEEKPGVRRGSDCVDFAHLSFSASTLRRFAPDRPKGPEPSACDGAENGVCEVPSMLSAQGHDLGTVGFEHYLQIPVADSTLKPAESMLEKRKLLHTNPKALGMQKLDVEYLVQRLTSLSRAHAKVKEASEGDRSVAAAEEDLTSEELFSRLLSDKTGAASALGGRARFGREIEALVHALGQTELWHDFSLVEWRIRAGQLLWASQEAEQLRLDEDREPSEMEVLLLQATLAAELLVRKESFGQDKHYNYPGIAETPSIAWCTVLARVILENLALSLPHMGNTSVDNRKSFFSALSFFTAKEEEEDRTSIQPLTYPKKETTQLEGLLHFAEKIGWPHAQDVRYELEQKLAAPSPRTSIAPSNDRRQTSMAFSIYATPLGSPCLSPPTMATPATPGARSSYFGGSIGAPPSPCKRPGTSRMITAQSMHLLPANNGSRQRTEGFEVGGWLSRSWLTGLVMPGEAASHFLMGTLLENSPHAIEALGEQANLYGGFLYRGRMFWSKSCVVGRVLAACDGARECMGWIAVEDLSRESIAEGWINADVLEAPEPPTPRIKQGGAVADDSDPLCGYSAAELKTRDFITPIDGPPVLGNEVRCEGIAFTNDHPSESATEQTTAELTFSSTLNSKLPPLRVPLTYDIHFISSYPCHPTPSAPRPRAQATTPSYVHGHEDGAHPQREKPLPSPPAYPLHINYTFTTIPVTALLSASPAGGRVDALSPPGETVPAGEQDGDVTVLDCRGTGPGVQDLDMLARAWCAKVGESAVVGREGRTCLSCCVREARALGVRVVIRI